MLASAAAAALKEAFGGESLSVDVLSAKIKVLAGRKQYIKNPGIASGLSLKQKDTDLYEDANPDHMWRWEVTTLDLLPEDGVKPAKAARTARRKLQSQFNAIGRLLGALNESIKLLGDAATKQPKTKIDKVVSKISREEEKVLKFEQEAEKARLSAEAKKQKDAQKQRKSKEEKERIKEEKRKAAEERKREKEEAKRQKEEEKKRKALEREEAKQLKEEKEQQQQVDKEKAQQKQRKRMMSFFGGPAKKKPKTEAAKSKPTVKVPANPPHNTTSQLSGFDSEEFRNGIDSSVCEDKTAVFTSLSKQAKSSSKRKTKRIKMRVFVSGVNADDPFAAQPAFAEERMVDIRDRNIFLLFQEDCR